MPLTPFPYQLEGAQILAQRDRFGLHDEMGVGKTATTILAANAVNARRGIVIAPAMLRENWINEFRKFSPYRYTLCKGQDRHDLVAWLKGRFEILVTSYELATKWAPQINETCEVIDFVATDEAHYLKNRNSARTRAILGEETDGVDSVITMARHYWHVTGTLMANDPADAYPFLRAVRSMDLPFRDFTRTFFNPIPGAYGIRYTPRDDTVEDLKALISNNSIRRTKQSIGMQLPPIFMTTSFVDGDDEQIIALLREHPGLSKEIEAVLNFNGTLSFGAAQHVATLRRLIGEAKAVPYAHMLYDELMQGTDKRVVFGLHINALKTVRDFLSNKGIRAVLVNGETSERDRIEAVRSFQEDELTQVFIGNIRAAGVGLTLTAACEIDILESDWSPAGNAQAIMRIHRIGQTRHVRARFITLAKSFDVKVNEIVAEKTAAIAQIEGTAMHAAPEDVLAQFLGH